MRELVGPLVSVHRLVLFFSDMYSLFGPPVHSVAFSVGHFGLIPIHDMVKTRERAWSVTADFFCSVAADLLVLRVYAISLVTIYELIQRH